MAIPTSRFSMSWVVLVPARLSSTSPRCSCCDGDLDSRGLRGSREEADDGSDDDEVQEHLDARDDAGELAFAHRSRFVVPNRTVRSKSERGCPRGLRGSSIPRGLVEDRWCAGGRDTRTVAPTLEVETK